MKTKQIIILSLALVFPIAIFLFLKSFGKNEFDVEPLYQKGEVTIDMSCGKPIVTPYFASETELVQLQWSSKDSLTLVVFEGIVFDEKEVTLRLSELFGNADIQLRKVSVDASSVDRIKNCVLLLEKGKNAALVDAKRRLRGYYNLADREEVDRLVVELKIILKKY